MMVARAAASGARRRAVLPRAFRSTRETPQIAPGTVGVTGCGLPVCTEFAESAVFVVEVMGHRDRGQQMNPLGSACWDGLCCQLG